MTIFQSVPKKKITEKGDIMDFFPWDCVCVCVVKYK